MYQSVIYELRQEIDFKVIKALFIVRRQSKIKFTNFYSIYSISISVLFVKHFHRTQ